MNIIKGIDRIAVILAFIALIPGGYFGYLVYEKEIEYIETTEYRNWLKIIRLIEMERTNEKKLALIDDIGLFKKKVRISPSEVIWDDEKAEPQKKITMSVDELENTYQQHIREKFRQAGFMEDEIDEY